MIHSHTIHQHGGKSANLLLLFTRWPSPGRVKTRLIPALGPEGAAEVQRQLTTAALRVADLLERRGVCRTEVHFDGGDAHLMRSLFGCARHYIPQEPGVDLGGRMSAAFRRAFASGAQRVVVIGSDCPDLRAELVNKAFDHLRKAPLVIGPAHDGGYYLLGMREYLPSLFEGIDWGGASVCRQTLEKAQAAGEQFSTLEPLYDVDRPEDWACWQQGLGVGERR